MLWKASNQIAFNMCSCLCCSVHTYHQMNRFSISGFLTKMESLTIHFQLRLIVEIVRNFFEIEHLQTVRKSSSFENRPINTKFQTLPPFCLCPISSCSFSSPLPFAFDFPFPRFQNPPSPQPPPTSNCGLNFIHDYIKIARCYPQTSKTPWAHKIVSTAQDFFIDLRVQLEMLINSVVET